MPFLILAATCILSAGMTLCIRHVAPRVGLVDRPDQRRKLHATPVPVAGGLAVFLSTLLVVGTLTLVPNGWQEELLKARPALLSLLAASVMVVLLGLADDRFSLRGRQKLAGQIVVALWLAYSGHTIGSIELLGYNIELGLLSVPFTIFWLLGAMNAINLLDGIDGLATTLGIILTLTIAAMGAMTHHPSITIVGLAFAGGLIGFLYFNFPPASIFLGDTGSMLIGLVVGTLAIQGAFKSSGTVLLAAPLAVFWTIPSVDSLAAIIRRKLTGQSIYASDRGHFHHCLLLLLGSNRRVLACVAILSGLTSAATLVSLLLRNDFVALVSCVAVVAILVATGAFGRSEFSLLTNRLKQLGVSLFAPAPGRKPRQNVVRLQGSLPWDALWEQLTDTAERLPINRIQFYVNLPTAHEAYHATWQRQSPPGEPAGWHLEWPLTLNDRPVGTMIIVGQGTTAQPSREIELLSSLLTPIQEHLHMLLQQGLKKSRDAEDCGELVLAGEDSAVSHIVRAHPH